MLPLTKEDLPLEGRIEMHLNNGFTKVRVLIGGERFRFIDVPTKEISAHLRSIGLQVLLTYKPAEKPIKVNDQEFYLAQNIVIGELPKDFGSHASE
jgi:hypothetical protein